MDQYYAFPEDKVREVKQAKPWCNDAKYFKKVKISPSATIKMLTHGQSGVEKGISQSGKPVEVMGLLLGRPDTEDLTSMIITDAMPMPCEGFETRVIVDDENVINYMIEMGESIEQTRQERFCGWYHTHPFDLDGTSHCYLSNTDVSTQLHWQRAEDKHGNHWLAIVIDPLLSLHQSRPEMMAFRVFPPEYSGAPDETPDGRIVREERTRVALWGACWSRYYRLEIEYFMSTLAQETLEIMRTQLLWPKAFTSSAVPTSSNHDKTLQQLTSTLEHAAGTHKHKPSSRRQDEDEGDVYSVSDPVSTAGPSTSASKSTSSGTRDVRGLTSSAQSAAALCRTHACTVCSLLLKQAVFCSDSSSLTDSNADSIADSVGQSNHNRPESRAVSDLYRLQQQLWKAQSMGAMDESS